MEQIDEIKDFIKQNKPIFKKWETYLKSENWSEIIITNQSPYKEDVKFLNGLYDSRSKEFQTQVGVIKNILSRINFFIKKAKQDYKNRDFKRFYKYSVGLIKLHQERCDYYLGEVDLTVSIDRQKEVDFQNIVFTNYSKIDDELKAILFVEDDEKPKDLIEFYEDKKASLAVYKEVMRDFPFVRKKIESMKIDFDSPPPPTLHILNKKPPIWDSEKNFWEQEKGTIQYYIDELKKIEYGIEIDGYFFDGWLYYHINHFVTPIPHTITINGVEENEDRIIVPPLRDNEVIMTDYFIKAKNDQAYALVAATRRAAKTTLNASRVERAKLIGRRQILVAGGSPKDLGQIEDNCRVYDDNCNPAFKLYYLVEDDKGGKEYGIRTKDNKKKRHTTAYFINLEAGVKKTKTEILAGFTPDEFILDEAFKFHFASQLEGLEPALFGQGVMRCIPIITATGGDDDLAADGIKMLNHPEDNKVTLMDWDKFEEKVPEQYRTWNKKPFGLFLPGQMSTRFGEKIYIPFSDYLGLEKEDAPTLSKLKIGITDWENTTKNIHQEREEKASDKRKYIKFLAYHPLTPEDIFMSGKENPFPVQEAKAHRRYLEETGLWDARKEVYKDTTGKIKIEPSKRELIPYPFKGISDAPCLIFEVPPPKDQIPYGMYTAGFDDYKQDDSDTDSVATFYVWKNIMLGDKWSKRIVASLSIRPDKHREVWEKWLLLMELYNLMQTAFGENEDFRIKDFLESRKSADYYLAPNLNFTQSFTITNNRKRDFGWTPRTTKKFLMDLFIDYCNEEHEVEFEDGSIKIYKGVQLIDDIYLLDEIINYNEHANVDRIIGAIGGLGYIHYLNASRSWNSSKNYKKNIEEEQQVQKTFQKSFYANNLRGTYGNIKKRR
jgi:hypothetical protein